MKTVPDGMRFPEIAHAEKTDEVRVQDPGTEKDPPAVGSHIVRERNPFVVDPSLDGGTSGGGRGRRLRRTLDRIGCV